MKRSRHVEYREGQEAASRFDDTTKRILNVSKEELLKREELDKEKRRTEKASRRTK